MFLKTERTYIRPFIVEDIDELYQLCTSPEAMQYIPPHYGIETSEQVAERLDSYIKHYEQHGISYGYVADAEGNFIGRAGFYFVPEVHKYEIGYSLLPEYWGKGYGTELVSALTDHAFDHLSIDTICARSVPGNIRSEAVLYKNGFTFLGERAFDLENGGIIRNYFEKDNEENLMPSESYQLQLADGWDL